MGLETALFAAEGARVVITGRKQKEQNEAADRSIGSAALAVPGDVSKMADLDRLYSIIKDKHGRLDVMFANAGGGAVRPFAQVTEDQFDREFAINVKGVFFTVQKALPLLSDGASIILNASVAASKGLEAMSVYSATKAAVRSFARTWTTDLRARRIRVNSLSPGPIDTPIFGKMEVRPKSRRAASAKPCRAWCRWGGWVRWTRSPARCWSLPRTTAASSPASTSVSTAAWRRCDGARRILVMAKSKTTETDASVDAYIAAIADETRRVDCRDLVRLMGKVTRNRPRCGAQASGVQPATAIQQGSDFSSPAFRTVEKATCGQCWRNW